MSWTLCTLSGALFKAGVNRNTSLSGADLNLMSDMAEDTFCMKTRKDWVTTYATDLSGTHLVGCVADAVSADIAKKIINADSSGFLKGEAQTMLDVLADEYNSIVKLVVETQNQKLNK